MAYWLLKTEPSTYGWDDLTKTGAKGDAWTGVKNHTAKQNLMKMKKGDRAFFYHTGDEKRIVGVADVIGEHYLDPTDATETFVAVDVKAAAPMPNPVTLAAIKADRALMDMALVKYARLSVLPVTPEEWKKVRAMGGLKA